MYNTLLKYPSKFIHPLNNDVDAVIMTGGPPFNLEELLKQHSDISVSTWYAQGNYFQ